jgi:hypothetical protein
MVVGCMGVCVVVMLMTVAMAMAMPKVMPRIASALNQPRPPPQQLNVDTVIGVVALALVLCSGRFKLAQCPLAQAQQPRMVLHEGRRGVIPEHGGVQPQAVVDLPQGHACEWVGRVLDDHRADADSGREEVILASDDDILH